MGQQIHVPFSWGYTKMLYRFYLTSGKDTHWQSKKSFVTEGMGKVLFSQAHVCPQGEVPHLHPVILSSTGPMSFLGGYSSAWSHVPPLSSSYPVLMKGYPSQVRMGHPSVLDWMEYPQLGLDWRTFLFNVLFFGEKLIILSNLKKTNKMYNMYNLTWTEAFFPRKVPHVSRGYLHKKA